MAFKKPDLISDKARALEAQIAALESEIQKLGGQIKRSEGPKFRSSTVPGGMGSARLQEPDKPALPAAKSEPVFEAVKGAGLTSTPATGDGPEIYNDLGVRKYDLPALGQRLRNYFSGPATSNPRLVNYLAAGGVHGLKPLRYERRVARNRFIALAAVLFLILFGTLLVYLQHH